VKYQLSPDIVALNRDVLGGEESVDIRAELGGYRSKLEKRAAGTWVPKNLGWFMYEPFSLKFPGGTYTVDFFGQMLNPMMDPNCNGDLVAVEVKGFNKNMRADRLKFKVAAAHHTWLKFVWLTWKNGKWCEEWYKPK